MSILSEIAATLKTTEANAINRVMRMKLYATYCGRCGGSGHYSRNAAGSTTCYSCNGVGAPIPKASDYPAILDNCKAAAADGRLATYLRYQDALKITKNAEAVVMSAWTATNIGPAYKWQNAAEFARTGNAEFKRDRDIADINAKMAAAYQSVSSACSKLNSRSETYQLDVIALAETLTAAFATITAADAEFKAYLEANPAA